MFPHKRNTLSLEEYREIHKVESRLKLHEFIGNLLFDPVVIIPIAALWGIYLILGG